MSIRSTFRTVLGGFNRGGLFTEIHSGTFMKVSSIDRFILVPLWRCHQLIGCIYRRFFCFYKKTLESKELSCYRGDLFLEVVLIRGSPVHVPIRQDLNVAPITSVQSNGYCGWGVWECRMYVIITQIFFSQHAITLTTAWKWYFAYCSLNMYVILFYNMTL